MDTHTDLLLRATRRRTTVVAEKKGGETDQSREISFSQANGAKNV